MKNLVAAALVLVGTHAFAKQIAVDEVRQNLATAAAARKWVLAF